MSSSSKRQGNAPLGQSTGPGPNHVPNRKICCGGHQLNRPEVGQHPLADGRIVAVLDLEEATYRHRVDDLAKAAVLLGTRYHDWRPTPADVRAAFVAAYASVLPLSEGDLRALEESIEAHLRHV